MTENTILVIGASGGIGKAVVEAFSTAYPDSQVYALSRSDTEFAQKNVKSIKLDTGSEHAVAHWCQANREMSFRYVVGCVGVLHSEESALSPEKRLEDISTEGLSQYFTVNTIVPAIWIKHLVNCVSKSASTVCFLSARVGSITDNKLGGWYGYRASKSALNMIMKTASVEYRRRTKHTGFVCYHPGTVDTALSKPFQANVKPEKLFSSAFTAERLVDILAKVDTDNGPYYLDWDGKPIQW
ncbi:SDR family NAD(P)-dependent oxidoreductase [Alteromonas sediminis]|uniref:SDR family NAD(P)-dependent oxidoreductase n=1 Tax=Alteromonas sediminis TaxID=2259342 RepID=A0A3N5YBD8_9ALTE|nr:SDR family NAD(P)-dependent oxidoreductase [Alteromonas sediminis]RPJ66265.1 SDR family NAD(P)-dependent oxidoreductase [Alteromonas sediminis]